MAFRVLRERCVLAGVGGGTGVYSLEGLLPGTSWCAQGYSWLIGREEAFNREMALNREEACSLSVFLCYMSSLLYAGGERGVAFKGHPPLLSYIHHDGM